MRASLVASAAVAFALFSGVAGLACSTQTIVPLPAAQSCTLQVVGMTIIASPKINPEEDGSARPVQLRLYQLKTDTRLLNASFDQVWKDDKTTLADDIVKVEEFPVYPDTRTEVKFERDPAALFVVAVALFRNPKGRTWWTEFELPPPPGKGNCMFPAKAAGDAKCAGPDCPEAGPPPLAPHYAIWIDQDRIDNGEDHLDEYPDATRMRDLDLHFTSPAGRASPSLPSAPNVPSAPDVPAAPQAPAAPTMPSVPGGP